MEEGSCQIDSLKKYIPFIDFILKNNEPNYQKFKQIKEWIVSNRRFPRGVIMKCEESMICQYRSIVVTSNNSLPKDIRDIFRNAYSGTVECAKVNLCSDEDSDDEVQLVSVTKPTTHQPTTHQPTTSRCSTSLSIKYEDESAKLLQNMDLFLGKIEKTDDTKDGVDTQRIVVKYEEQPIFYRREDLPSIAKHVKKKKKKHKKHSKKRHHFKDDCVYSIDTSSDERDVDKGVSAQLFKSEANSCPTVPTEALPTSGYKNCIDVHKDTPLNENNIVDITLPGSPEYLENMGVDELKLIYENLLKVNGFDVETCLLNSLDNVNAPIETIPTIESMNIVEERSLQSNETFAINIGVSPTGIMSTNQQRLPHIQTQEGNLLHHPPHLLHPSNLAIPPFQVHPGYQPHPPSQAQPNNNNLLATVGQPPNAQQLLAAIYSTTGRRLNLNDPRIVRELERIQNSPLYSSLIRSNGDIAHLSALNQNKSYVQTIPAPQPAVTYGEYKRLKQMKQKESELMRLKEEERKINDEKRINEEKKIDDKRIDEERKINEERTNRAASYVQEKAIEPPLPKNDQRETSQNDKRQQFLMDTLKPYENQLKNMLSVKVPKSDNTQQNVQKSKDMENAKTMKNIVNENSNTPDIIEKEIREILREHTENLAECSDNTEKPQSNNRVSPTNKRENENNNNKLNKALKGLECTFKGYDKLQDYVLPNIGGKRRCSISARTAIAEQLNSDYRQYYIEENFDVMSEDSINNSLQAMVTNDNAAVIVTPKRRKSTSDSAYKRNTAKRKKIDDTVVKSTSPTVESSVRNIVECNSNSFDTDTSYDYETFRVEKAKSLALTKQPVVLLHRLEDSLISKYMSKEVSNTATGSFTQMSLDVQLVEATTKKSDKYLKTIQKNGVKAVPIRQANIDCCMTERNTKLCVLCKSKPFNLTNHYIRTHKSESYTSRLSWEELDDLQLNIPFALAVSSNVYTSVTKYKIKCAFCSEEVQDTFTNFHKHYSTHTGEYAFQCSSCKFLKPYRTDIQNHMLNSKACRNARIHVQYLYKPNLMVIYLHSCKICNFVQLNEANVFKHLREHHQKPHYDATSVKKYILAAINDSETSTNLELPEDDGVTVSNEAMYEEESPIIETNRRVEDLLDELFSNDEKVFADKKSMELEEKFCDLHFASAPLSPAIRLEREFLPITQIHVDNEPTNIPILHKPMPLPEDLKPDIRELEANIKNQHIEKMSVMHTVKNELCDSFAIENSLDICSTDDKPLDLSNSMHPVKICGPRPHLLYKTYPSDTPYYGLLKCMAADCFFSTDVDEDLLEHLNDHSDSACPPQGIFECAYCQLGNREECASAQLLIDHIRKVHFRSHFQCPLCSYRSCLPDHVRIHKQHSHPTAENIDMVYKCDRDADNTVEILPQMQVELQMAMWSNVQKLKCSYCPMGFYSLSCMENHINRIHNLLTENIHGLFACIYCSENFNCDIDVKKHLAIEHPHELAYVCERILKPGLQNDDVHNLQLNDMSTTDVPVPTQIRPDLMEQNNAIGNVDGLDLKPNVVELDRMNEEAVKVLLTKLTLTTGIAPDRLYHCPEPACGGFFSVFRLWSQHMSLRHNIGMVSCPHCPETDKIELLLIDFETHFQSHCRHLFLCFHCGETYANEDLLRDHAAISHKEIQHFRLEKITFNINYSYYVLIDHNLHIVRLEFLMQLREMLLLRCQYVEDLESQKVLVHWKLALTERWLEDYPRFYKQRPVEKRCFNPDCAFRTRYDMEFIEHVRLNHSISKTQSFTCSKCSYRARGCKNWDPILDHIQMHNANLYICCVCNFYHYTRRTVTLHIQREHDSRDVPVLSLLRSDLCINASVSITFASTKKTFSSRNNCFCCSQTNLDMYNFARHLKRSHDIKLRYFCDFCDDPLKLLQSEDHFKSNHASEALKIRCELASNSELTIVSVVPLSVQMKSKNFVMKIKQEKCDEDSDDSVTILEDEDLVADEDFKIRNNPTPTIIAEPTRIKCVNIQSLLRPSNNLVSEITSAPALSVMPLTNTLNPPAQRTPYTGFQNTPGVPQISPPNSSVIHLATQPNTQQQQQKQLITQGLPVSVIQTTYQSQFHQHIQPQVKNQPQQIQNQRHQPSQQQFSTPAQTPTDMRENISKVPNPYENAFASRFSTDANQLQYHYYNGAHARPPENQTMPLHTQAHLLHYSIPLNNKEQLYQQKYPAQQCEPFFPVQSVLTSEPPRTQSIVGHFGYSHLSTNY